MPVNGKVFKFAFAIQGMEVFATDDLHAKVARGAIAGGRITPETVNISVTEATEADLCAAQKCFPTRTVEFEKLISYLKTSATPTTPLRVEIVNASELSKDTVLRIERNQSSVMTGAVAHKV